MSGRKSTEVAAVLEKSEEGRRETQRAIRGELSGLNGKISALQKEMDDILSGRATSGPELEEARREFPEQAQRLAGEYEKVMHALRSECSLPNPLDALRKEDDDLTRRLYEADREGASIRQAIARQNWYCDDEYRRAQILASTYRGIFSAQQKMLQNGAAALAEMTERRNHARQQGEVLSSLQREARSLENAAQKRRESNALREELRNARNRVDARWAEKLCAPQFETLRRKLEIGLALGDAEFLAQFPALYAQCVEFSTRVDEARATWERERSNCVDNLENLAAMKNCQLLNPLDHYRQNPDGDKLGLFQYLEKYGGKSPEATCADLENRAKKELEAENFAECMKLVSAAMEELGAAKSAAYALQQSMYQKAALADALEQSMYSLGYGTEMEIIGDNPADGFSLICTLGDEVITFDPVTIAEDGNVVMEVDHRESVTGTCGKSWGEIAKAMHQFGIPLANVRMKNGESVLFAENTASGKTKGTDAGKVAQGH